MTSAAIEVDLTAVKMVSAAIEVIFTAVEVGFAAVEVVLVAMELMPAAQTGCTFRLYHSLQAPPLSGRMLGAVGYGKGNQHIYPLNSSSQHTPIP